MNSKDPEAYTCRIVSYIYRHTDMTYFDRIFLLESKEGRCGGEWNLSCLYHVSAIYRRFFKASNDDGVPWLICISKTVRWGLFGLPENLQREKGREKNFKSINKSF